MINRFTIKFLLITSVAVILLWILLSGESGESRLSENSAANSAVVPTKLASAIHPVSDSQAALNTSGVVSGSLKVRADSTQMASFGNQDLASLTRRFEEANSAIEAGETQAAIASLDSLISEFPSVIEPYLNLASIYADQQQLGKAREVLLMGFDANPKAGMLFDHLKRVHGALAADSYRQALDTKAPAVSRQLKLARASAIVTQLDQSNTIATLEKQLQDSRNQIDSSQNASQTEKSSSVLALESQLDQVEANSRASKSAYDRELADLKSQLAEMSQALSLSQIAEREALARVVRAEQDASNKVAEINRELETQNGSLLALQALNDEQVKALAATQQSQSEALRQAEARLQAAKEAAASVASQASIAGASQNTESALQNRNEIAIGLVQSWARAWSAQDVPGYVKHYTNNYSSSRAITRRQWLDQRQLRLTNKEFINVEVSNFKVKDLGAQFSVTFSQYYRSNTVDDTVIKRLVFNKTGDDWSKSKIVNEQLVSS